MKRGKQLISEYNLTINLECSESNKIDFCELIFCVNAPNNATICVFQLDAQCSRSKEALMVADAFRIAFEQQLRKRNENFLLLTEANILKSHQEKAEGKFAPKTVYDV